MALEMVNVSKQFGETWALKNVTLRLKSGEIIALVGPNGAGKSTLIRLISGVMRPTNGKGRLYDYDLKANRSNVKAITGLLPEETALFEKLSVWEYIEFIGALYGVQDNLILERFTKFSKELSIYGLRDRLIETLSKGQKQKVALIAALIHDPKVLLLDEPMANLDVVAQIKVKEIIRQYKKDEKLIIIATHLLENVVELCDSIAIINEGEIRFIGNVNDFIGDSPSPEEAYLRFFKGD